VLWEEKRPFCHSGKEKKEKINGGEGDTPALFRRAFSMGTLGKGQFGARSSV